MNADVTGDFVAVMGLTFEAEEVDGRIVVRSFYQATQSSPRVYDGWSNSFEVDRARELVRKGIWARAVIPKGDFL